jgi:hypothetical protein
MASSRPRALGMFPAGKTCILGIFDTKEEAALAIDRHVRMLMLTNLQSKISLNYETITAAEEAATQAQAQAEHP